MTSLPTPSRRLQGLAVIAGLATLLAFAGCTRAETTHRELTERQRDSILGKTNIPGAFVVTRALAATDKAAAQAAQTNADVAAQDH